MKTNRAQFELLNKILSETATDERAALQSSINKLTDNGLQVYLDLQGKMDVSQQELVTRAEFGDINKYTLQQTVDYYEAEKLLQDIDADKDLQDLLSVTKKKQPKYADEKNQLQQFKNQLDKLNSPKDPTAIKTQVHDLKNKLTLENSARRMAIYIDKANFGKNPFENEAVYEFLVETAKAYIDNGGSDAITFKEYLKGTKRFERIKWSDQEVNNKVNEAFEDAKNPSKQNIFNKQDFVKKEVGLDGIITIYKGVRKFKIENDMYYEWDGTNWIDLKTNKQEFEAKVLGDKVENIPTQIENKYPEDEIPKEAFIKETTIANGKIYGGDGREITLDDFGDFVISENGDFVLGFRHLLLADKGKVLAAGEVLIINGKVAKINNLSGHYRPTLAETEAFPNAFRNVGIDVKGTILEYYNIGRLSRKPAKTIIIK